LKKGAAMSSVLMRRGTRFIHDGAAAPQEM
jgi:hypothetical protein